MDEGADQGAHPVRIPERERLVAREAGDDVDRVRPLRERLEREPLVDDQRVVAPLLVEALERRLAFGQLAFGQQVEGGDRIGHVAGGLELGEAKRASRLAARRHQVAERQIPERAPADLGGLETVGLLALERAVGLDPACAEAPADSGAQELAHNVDAVDVDLGHMLTDVGLRRKAERLGDEGVVKLAVAEGRGERFGQSLIERQLTPAPPLLDQTAASI